MPDTQGYAVVSCHVERPLDDEVWERYRALLERRPGGFPIASLMRPPAEGEDEALFVARAREAAVARALRPPHPLDVADPRAADRARSRGRGAPRGRLAARAGPRAALLLRRRLVHRRRRDRRRRRPRVHRLHRDGLAALVPAARARRAPGSPSRPGCVLRDGRRVLELPTTHSLGALARSLLGSLPPVVHVHFHDYELLEGRRRAALSSALAAPRASAAPGRARRARRRRGGRVGRRLRRLIAIGALAALAGCGSSPASRGVSVHVDTSPFRVTVLDNGKAVVSEDKDARLRFELASTGDEYSLTKVTSSKGGVYQVATTEPGRTATVTVDDDRDRGRDRRGAPSRSRHPVGLRRLRYRGPTSTSSAAARRASRSTCAARSCRSRSGTRARASRSRSSRSSGGWGIRLASQRSAALAFPGSTGGSGCEGGAVSPCSFPALTDRAEVCLQGAALDEHLYVGLAPADARRLRDRDRACRSCRRRPQLELIKWRDVVNGPGRGARGRPPLPGGEDPDRLGAASTTRGRAATGSSRSTRRRFPNPGGLISAVHRLGVKFMLWVSPRATCADGYPGKTLGAPGHQILDLRDPAVVAEYQRRIRELVALGVDGVKADRGDENDLSGVDPELTNDYPLLFGQAVMGALPKGAAAIFRAATVGSQSVVPGIWAGDQPQEYVGLQRAIVSAQTAAMSGFPTWGSDVGGYAGPPFDDAELFVRWAQLGAVSPVMEVGGIGGNATPWTLGPGAMSGLRAAAVLHYELFPYLYGLLAAHQPVIRPLAFGYPDDATSWGSNYEFLVGPDLLAAPVTGPGNDAERLPAARLVGRPLHRRDREGRRGGVHALDAAPAVPALCARRRGRAVQPAHGGRLVVGSGRADASRARRLPRDERRPARH